jgi:uncharacterized membrane protein
MSAPIYLTTIFLVLGTVLLVFGMRAVSAVLQAKVRSDQGEAYRALAEKAVSVQAEASTSMAAVETHLADIRARLTAVEKILKDVE